MQSLWRARGWRVAVVGVFLLLAGFAVPPLAVAQTAPAPIFPRDSSVLVVEPGDSEWDGVVLEVAVTLEEDDEEDDDPPPRSDYCFPYTLSFGTASDADVRLADGGMPAFVVVADNQNFAASDHVELAGDDLLEGDETFYLDVYEGQSGETTCSVGGVVIARVEVTIQDDDEDTSGISSTAFTVRETDRDASAALALRFEQAADADYCFAFEMAYARSSATGSDAWVGTRRSATGSFLLEAGLTEVVVRDVVIAGDDEVEETEVLYIDVYQRQRGVTSCSGTGRSVTAVLTVTIEDDDSDTSGISPTEFTVVETDEEAPAALELTFAQAADADYCFAFELAYGRSTAGRADAWVGTGKSSSGRFVLPAGLTQVVVRDLIIAGDDEVEETETLYIDVYERQRSSSCRPSGTVVAVLTVTIEDDDSDTSGISPTEFTVRETDTDAPAALALTFAQAADADYCFAFELAYGRSTAGAADAWVGTGKSSSGRFVLPAGLTQVVVRDLIIAGDDEVEETETLYIDVYERQRSSSCRPSGTVVAVLTVTIEDDDSDTSGISPTEFTVTETDSDAPAALALTFAQAADADYCFAFELAYGRSTAGAADAWVGSGGSASGSFILPAGLTDVVVRDVIIAGDDEVEGPETLYIDVYERQRAAACSAGGSVVAVLTVTIEDDDTDAPDLDGALEVIETDVDAVALLVLSLEEPVNEARCYPYRIAYSRSTAGSDDAQLVRTGGFAPADAGTFVAQPRSTAAVSSNLLVVGDDIIEGDETLYLDIYAPGPAREASCSPSGTPVRSIAVVIVDDDLPVEIASLRIDGAVEGLHREGDSGERESVHLIVTFARRLTEPVTLRYGSVADAEARGREPKQDVETVPERSVTVDAGHIAVRVRVATIIGDDRIEAVEYFSVWAAVDGYAAESKMWLRVGIANDDVPGDEILEVVLEGQGVEGRSIVEGDPDPGAGGGDCQREWKCIFLILGFTGDRQHRDVVYQVHTVAGSARPGEDYRFRDGMRVRLEEGHLRTFDVRDPLQLQVRRDFFVEGEREDLFLAVHMLAGGESPLFSWYERIEIIDDDRSGADGGVLWFGMADGLDSCPVPSNLVHVAEPLDGGVRPVRLELAVAGRGGGQPQPDGQDGPQPSGCEVGLGKPVTEYRYELRSGAAEVGIDVLGSGGSGGVVRFVSGRGSVDFGVVGDGRLEGAEDLTLALVGGAGTVALFTVVVEDAESARETVSSRTAGAVRIGRVLASEVSDVLADRFSCAASPACSALGARPEAQLWPGGRSGPVFSPETLLRRLARSAGSLAMPGMAPAAVTDGAALALPALAGSGLSDFGPSGFGVPGPGGRSHAPGAGAVAHGLHGPGHLDADRLAVVGRALDGLRYQGDPGRWLGAVNIARGDHRPAAWTFWARSSYAAVDDTSSTARRLSTSMLSMTGGLDREVGRFRVGVLYTHAFAQSETQVHGYAQEFVPADPVQGSSWRVVGAVRGLDPASAVPVVDVAGVGDRRRGLRRRGSGRHDADGRQRGVAVGVLVARGQRGRRGRRVRGRRRPDAVGLGTAVPDDRGRLLGARAAGAAGGPDGFPARRPGDGDLAPDGAPRPPVGRRDRHRLGLGPCGRIIRVGCAVGRRGPGLGDRPAAGPALPAPALVAVAGADAGRAAGRRGAAGGRRAPALLLAAADGLRGRRAVGRGRVGRGVVGVAAPVVRARLGRAARLVERGGPARRRGGRVRGRADARRRGRLRLRGRRPGVGVRPPGVRRGPFGGGRPRGGGAVRPRVVTACGRVRRTQRAVLPMRTASKVSGAARSPNVASRYRASRGRAVACGRSRPWSMLSGVIPP